MMVTTNAIYFEIRYDDPVIESRKRIWIFSDGHVELVRTFGSNRRDLCNEYRTIDEFKQSHPVVMSDILDYCRKIGRNFDEFIRSKSKDIIPIEKQCKKCGKVKPITKFPLMDTAFDSCHDECCDCRIEECKRIRGYCISPIGQGCGSCPVSEINRSQS